MVKDLTFQILKLLSQSLSTLKPEGDLYRQTSCVNPEEAEMMGFLNAVSDLIESEDEESADYLRKTIIPFIEKIGISKWSRGELTALGLRVGMRHVETIDVAKDLRVDESTIKTEESDSE